MGCLDRGGSGESGGGYLTRQVDASPRGEEERDHFHGPSPRGGEEGGLPTLPAVTGERLRGLLSEQSVQTIV